MRSVPLVIPGAILDQVLRHAWQDFPLESCGFLIGERGSDGEYAAEYLPLVNELRSPTAFRTEPASLFQAFRRMRQRQQELLAIVHSHPQSPAVPSLRDLAENTYGPAIPWLIVGLAETTPDVRLWWLMEHDFRPGFWELQGSSELASSIKPDARAEPLE